MNEDAPALRPALGHPGIYWSGDGALGGPTRETEAPPPAPVSADLRVRGIAFVIDFTILLAVAVVVLPVVTVIGGVDATAPQHEVERQIEDLYPVLYLVMGVIQFAYSLIWNTIGWSPGKRMAGLRTVDRDGRRPGLLRGLRRSAGLMLNVFGLGYLWALVDREKRTWHDRIGGTWVVRAGRERGRNPD